MRIVEESATRLVLKDRTAWITAVCFLAAVIITWQAVQHREPIIVAAILVAFGVAFLHMTDVVFDKTRRVANLRRLDVIRLTRSSFAFDDIVDVTVQMDPQPDNLNSISCRLAFRTRDATSPLTASYAPDLDPYNAMRDAILGALGRVPDTTVKADPVRELAEAGGIIDAVALLRQRENLDLATARERVAQLQREFGS
jgi:hypothetical protein